MAGLELYQQLNEIVIFFNRKEEGKNIYRKLMFMLQIDYFAFGYGEQ